MNGCFSPNRHRGFTVLEVVVAAVLVLALLSVTAPLIIQTGRMWQQTRHHQLAVDELAGQLDRLVSLPADRRDAALGSLTVDPDVARSLTGASLGGEVIDDDDGRRIRLRLQWQRRGDPPPIHLVAWIDPRPPSQRGDDAKTNDDDADASAGNDASPTEDSP